MNDVCYSAKNAFETRFNHTQSACNRADHGQAIYGTADMAQSLMVNKKGIRPDCSSGLIIESEEMDGLTNRDGSFLRREYCLNARGIEENMQNATRDELNLFLVLADPKILNNETIQAAFFDRLSTIQKEEGVQDVLQHGGGNLELRDRHEEETEKYSEFFGFFQNAVEGHYKTFYPAGYTPEAPLPEEN